MYGIVAPIARKLNSIYPEYLSSITLMEWFHFIIDKLAKP